MPLFSRLHSAASRALRRSSRFSMRTMLLLMSICCVCMGVWTLYVEPFRAQAASLQKVSELGGKSVSTAAAGPRWQRWLVETMVGSEHFVDVETVDLRGRRVTSRDVASLAGLRRLNTLYLDRGEVTDDNVVTLANMAELRQLSLIYTRVSDAGLTRLANHANLQTLYLTGTPVSDSSVKTLSSLPSLREVYVRWTGISADGARELQKALPKCAVHHHEIQRAVAARGQSESNADKLAGPPASETGGE
jgi:hypothetical protein